MTLEPSALLIPNSIFAFDNEEDIYMDAYEKYKEKFNESGYRIFEHAVRETQRREQKYLSIERMISALASQEPDLFSAILHDLAVDPKKFREFIEKNVSQTLGHIGESVSVSPQSIDLFKRALDRAKAQGRKAIGSTDLLAALAQDEEGVFIKALHILSSDSKSVKATIDTYVRNREDDFLRENSHTNQHNYAAGQMVRVTSGAYSGFTGRIEDMNADTLILKVLVNVFGRSTAITLHSLNVEIVAFTVES